MLDAGYRHTHKCKISQRPYFPLWFLTCSFAFLSLTITFPHVLFPHTQVFPALSAHPRSGRGDFGVSRLRLGCGEQGHSEALPEKPSYSLSDCHLGLQLLSAVLPGRGGHLSLRHHLPHFRLISVCLDL